MYACIMYVCMNVRMYVCMYVWMDGWMDVCMYMYVCMYVSMYVCMYGYVSCSLIMLTVERASHQGGGDGGRTVQCSVPTAHCFHKPITSSLGCGR